MAILCECVLDRLSLKDASKYLQSSQSDEDNLEPPTQGALTAAAALGEVALIKALSNGAETCRTSKFFFSPLCTAAKYGNLEVISVLLGKGTLDASCLVEACLVGHKHIVDVYLTPGFHLDYTWWEIQNMLFAAVFSSKYPLIRQIISLYSTTERPDLLQNAYFQAVKHPSLEMVDKLIDSGINISLYHHGETALGMAAARGELAVVKLLLARGFDKSHISYNDSLTQAAMGGHEHVVAFLLDEGIDINSRKKRPLGNQDMEGDRCAAALFSAAIRGEDHLFQFLLDRGAKLDPKDGKTALGVACTRGDERLRQFLLDAGLDGSHCGLTERAWAHDCLVSQARVGAIQRQ